MSTFSQRIQNSTAHRPIRDELSGEVFKDPALFPELISIALNLQDKSHHKACWILELVLEKEIDWLKDFLPQFCNALPQFRHEGALRSVSKICLFCVQRHIRHRDNFLSPQQLQQVTEACFDWLISDAKVATKAYAMRALYLIGKSEDWIHPELQVILTQGFPLHSAAYKAAAKEILQKISRV
jgi:hypothetical protein